MCKVWFNMQMTGSQANFTLDILNSFLVLVNVTKISSERFIEKLAFWAILLSLTLTRSVEKKTRQKHLYTVTSLLSVLNLIMHLSRKLLYGET